MKKRWIAWTLLLAMLLLLLPCTAFAGGPTEGDCGAAHGLREVHWAYREGVLTISGQGDIASFDNLWNYETPWKEWLPQIKQAVIGQGITGIGYQTFMGCTALETLSLPESLAAIDPWSGLADCTALQEIRVARENRHFCAPEGVLYTADRKCLLCYPAGKAGAAYRLAAETRVVGASAFRGNQALEEVILPQGLEQLEDRAFRNCAALERIQLPDSLREVGEFVFDGTGFYNRPENWDGPTLYLGRWLLSTRVLPENTSLTLRPDTVGLAAGALNRSGTGAVTSLTLPGSVKYICAFALSGLGIREITLPEQLAFLGAYAFYDNTALQTAVLPPRLSEMGACVFEGCTSLTEVRLPADLQAIPNSAFAGCTALEKLRLPGSITAIGSYAFSGCSALREVHIPGGITEMGRGAFDACPMLRDLYFGGSRAQWEALRVRNSFYDPAVTTVHFAGASSLSGTCGPELVWALDKGVLTVTGSGEMYDFLWEQPLPWGKFSREIKKLVIGDGVTSLGNGAFRNCTALTEVSLGSTVRTLGMYAFEGCSALESLWLPDGIASLDPTVFTGCTGLTRLTVSPENPHFSAPGGILFSADGKILYFYPQGLRASSYVLPPVCEAIADGAFRENPFLRCIGAGRALTSIGPLAFEGCPCLTDLYYGGTSADWAKVSGRAVPLNLHFLWEPDTEPVPSLRALETDNAGRQDYRVYARPVASYLIPGPEGSLTRLECVDGAVIAEEYDRSRNLTGRSCVTLYELPLFGGFYQTDQYYFLVFGAENPGETNEQEVIRTVRYTRDWKRLDDARLLGSNTTIPFDAGSLRMTHRGDYLYVHTCHSMYETSDGLHHQANLLFSIHIPTMRITDCQSSISSEFFGYVSHSFNQFIAADGDRLVTLCHGDGYPRAVALFQYEQAAGQETFTGPCAHHALLEIAGFPGNNITQASVGGLEVLEGAYLTGGNSIDQTREENTQRNIFLCSTPAGTVGSPEQTRFRWITAYEEQDQVAVSTPQLVQLPGNRVMVLWTEARLWEPEKETLCYTLAGAEGEALSEIYRWKGGQLSDCKPIVTEDAVTWYVTRDSAPVFYSIPLARPQCPEILRVVNHGETCSTETLCGGGAGCPGRSFEDMPPADHWAHQGIDYALAHGLFSGVSQTRFRPDSPMTRAMLVTVLWRCDGKPQGGSCSFRDVPENQWFTEAIAWASGAGIVSGVGDGRFNPEGKVTREQMSAILYRYARRKGFDTSPRGSLEGFPDFERVSPYAEESLSWAVAEQLIRGSGPYLRPQGSATRAQVASILMRFLRNFDCAAPSK